MRKTTQGGGGTSATESPESCQVETQHVRAALPQFRTREASLTQGHKPPFPQNGKAFSRSCLVHMCTLLEADFDIRSQLPVLGGWPREYR